ncbi:hypothetical protein BU17DRAFT_76769 [Hysterangium stoloniferum]|nr:hypothetical protein BU17DRAFT_76769 [Hysterangium stoloniferum]
MVSFPRDAQEPSSSQQLPVTPSRPTHLPFRRISLPTPPHGNENRFSIVSSTSVDSTPEENQPETPALIRSFANQRKDRVPTSPHRVYARQRTSSNRLRESLPNKEMKDKRRKVINEILETERVYVSGLDLIYTNFLTPLVSSLDTPQPLLDRSELTAIFSNFIDIWNLHRSFFTSLSSLVSGTIDPPPLSPVFISHFPYLSLYTPFVTSFPAVLSSLSSLMAHSQTFANFVRTQEADPRCGKLGLKDWLLTIVQRCPRYLLLLKDLISCTDPSDPEHSSLTTVHSLLSKITQSLNMSLHTHSQTLSLLALQKATPNLPFQLIAPGRSLVRRGQLKQGQVEGDTPDAREFLLFSDRLVWLARVDERSIIEHRPRQPRLHRNRTRSETELPTSSKRWSGTGTEEKWDFKGHIELVDLEVVTNPAGRDASDYTRLDLLSPGLSFAVYAVSEKERDEWTTAIRNAKSSLLVSLNMTHPNSTLTSSEATTHLRRVLQALPNSSDDGPNQRRGRVDHFLPAVWIPDSKTDSCMRCKATFGWRRRRHHCRLCGRCICADCSGKTFLISDSETKDTKPARACNACYETVFPILSDPSPQSAQPSVEVQTSSGVNLGTLSRLPQWQSIPSFEPPTSSETSASLLLKPPPSAFHEPHRPRLRTRPQSQPVLPHITLSSANTSSTSIDRHSQQLDSDPSISIQGSSLCQPIQTLAEDDGEYSEATSPLPSQANRRRWSTAALAVHTEPVTARPTSSGEGLSKRFSFLLSSQIGTSRKSTQTGGVLIDNKLSRGAAAGKLSEILGRNTAKQI